MTTATQITYTATTRRSDRAPIWTRTEGSQRMYAPRAEGQSQPSAWVLWSPRQRDVSTGDVMVAYDASR